MRYKCLVPTLLLAVLGACGTIDRRVSPDEPDLVGGTGLQSQDIVVMADQMARSIVEAGILRSNDPEQRISFHVLSLRNDSSNPGMDKEIVLTKIRTELHRALGRQVKILDASKEGMEAIRAQIAAKAEGAVTSNPNMRGALAGSDYALKGTIKDRVQQSRDLKSVYHLVTFELVDLVTGELSWTADYETKFVSEKSVITR